MKPETMKPEEKRERLAWAVKQIGAVLELAEWSDDLAVLEEATRATATIALAALGRQIENPLKRDWPSRRLCLVKDDRPPSSCR